MNNHRYTMVRRYRPRAGDIILSTPSDVPARPKEIDRCELEQKPTQPITSPWHRLPTSYIHRREKTHIPGGLAKQLVSNLGSFLCRIDQKSELQSMVAARNKLTAYQWFPCQQLIVDTRQGEIYRLSNEPTTPGRMKLTTHQPAVFRSTARHRHQTEKAHHLSSQPARSY